MPQKLKKCLENLHKSSKSADPNIKNIARIALYNFYFDHVYRKTLYGDLLACLVHHVTKNHVFSRKIDPQDQIFPYDVGQPIYKNVARTLCSNFSLDHLFRKKPQSGQKQRSVIFATQKIGSRCQRMNFLTNFFTSPIQTSKEKVVARKKCYTKMGSMRSVAKFHIDI